MKHLAFLFIGLSVSVALSAQSIDFNNYKPIESQNPLPPQFETTWKDKVDLINNETAQTKGRKSKKENEDFVVTTTYTLDRLFTSGIVLFNTPIDSYINQVMQEILNANDLDDKVTVYVVKSRDVNAFAVTQNIIFVNIGLLAKIETEAELAFVLCHEYIHYANKHTFTTYKKDQELEKNYKRYKNIDENDALIMSARYSRDLEREADKEGLKLFLNTQYSLSAPEDVLLALQYSHLPIDLVPFDRDYFNDKNLTFPNSFFLDTLAEISVQDDDDKHYKFRSHPGMEERKESVRNSVQEIDNTGRKDFIISKTKFFEIRNMARFELVRLELIDRDYEMAFYNAYILEKDFPDNRYVKTLLLKSVYDLATYANYSKFNAVTRTERKTEGDFQQVIHFFESFSRNELCLFAIHYAWKIHKMFPDDKEITAIADDIIEQGIRKRKLKWSDFEYHKPITPDTVKTDNAPVDSSGGARSTKISKIKSSSKKKKEEPTVMDSAFVDIIKDKEFADKINYHLKQRDSTEVYEEVFDKRRKKSARNMDLEGTVKTGEMVKNILLFDPTSIKLDTRKNRKKQYLATEKSKEKMKKRLAFSSKKAGVNLTFLDRTNIGVDSVQKINDLSFVYDYLNERIEHNNTKILPTDQTKIQEICERYEIDHIGIAGEIRFIYPASKWNIALLFTPLMPYAIIKLAVPRVSTVFFLAVYNTETNNIAYSTATMVISANNEDAAIGNWYSLFQDMNSQK